MILPIFISIFFVVFILSFLYSRYTNRTKVILSLSPSTQEKIASVTVNSYKYQNIQYFLKCDKYSSNEKQITLKIYWKKNNYSLNFLTINSQTNEVIFNENNICNTTTEIIDNQTYNFSIVNIDYTSSFHIVNTLGIVIVILGFSPDNINNNMINIPIYWSGKERRIISDLIKYNF